MEFVVTQKLEHLNLHGFPNTQKDNSHENLYSSID